MRVTTGVSRSTIFDLYRSVERATDIRKHDRRQDTPRARAYSTCRFREDALTISSAITPKPATDDRLKTGHFERPGTVQVYFAVGSFGKLAA